MRALLHDEQRVVALVLAQHHLRHEGTLTDAAPARPRITTAVAQGDGRGRITALSLAAGSLAAGPAFPSCDA
jgi:hypothetical protein